MSNNFSSNPSGYTPIFEIGLMDNGNPAVKAFMGVCSSICPITLAAIATTLFETVMLSVDENKQIDYEKNFNKALKKIMKERHNLEITKKLIEPDSSDDEPYED